MTIGMFILFALIIIVTGVLIYKTADDSDKGLAGSLCSLICGVFVFIVAVIYTNANILHTTTLSWTFSYSGIKEIDAQLFEPKCNTYKLTGQFDTEYVQVCSSPGIEPLVEKK